jgi:hypothetical protein
MDAHKYEQRTRRHGNRRLVEAIGTTAMQTHSSAGWFPTLGPLLSPKAPPSINKDLAHDLSMMIDFDGDLI